MAIHFPSKEHLVPGKHLLRETVLIGLDAAYVGEITRVAGARVYYRDRKDPGREAYCKTTSCAAVTDTREEAEIMHKFCLDNMQAVITLKRANTQLFNDIVLHNTDFPKG